MSEIRPEVRGMRLLVGAGICIVTTYWFLTGKVFNPFAESIVASMTDTPEGVYGNGLSDAIDILTAVIYLVGTIATVAGDYAYRIISAGLKTLADYIRGSRKVVDDVADGGEAQPEAGADPASKLQSFLASLKESVDKLTERVDSMDSKSEGEA